MTEPLQELEGSKKCSRFFFCKASEKSWGVLSFRNLFWFLKLHKQSLNNVVMSTSGTQRITTEESKWLAQISRSCRFPGNGDNPPLWSRAPALLLLCWNLCTAQWIRFAPSNHPKHQSKSSLWLMRGAHSSPRREKSHSQHLSDGFRVREALINLFVMAPLSSLHGGRKPGNCRGRERATNNSVISSLVLRSHGLAAQPGLCLGYWSCQLTSGLAGRVAVGRGGFCSKQKQGEQSVCNPLNSKWADTQTD